MVNCAQELETDSFSNIRDDNTKKALLNIGKRARNSVLNEQFGTPVYYWDETGIANKQPVLIEDYVLIDIDGFEQRRLVNIYRGCGSLIIQLKDCVVALHDKDRQWFGPIDRIAKPSEAKDLKKTALQSVIDGKIFVCDQEERFRIIPDIPGVENMNIDDTMDSWGFKAKQGVKSEGSVTSQYAFNPKLRTLDAVVVWHIDRNASDIKLFHQRDPFSGNLSGEVLVGLNHHYKGAKIGYWSGQRGFIKTPTRLSLNPILSRHFNSNI